MPAYSTQIRTYSKKNQFAKLPYADSSNDSTNLFNVDPFDKLLKKPDANNADKVNHQAGPNKVEKLKPLAAIRATYNRHSSFLDDSIVAIRHYDREQLERCFTNTHAAHNPSPEQTKNEQAWRLYRNNENAENNGESVNGIAKVAHQSSVQSNGRELFTTKETGDSLATDEDFVENVKGGGARTLPSSSTPIITRAANRNRQTLMQISPICNDNSANQLQLPVPEVTVDDASVWSIASSEVETRKSKSKSVEMMLASKKLRPSTSVPRLTINDDAAKGVTQRKSSRASPLYVNVSSPMNRSQHVTVRRSSKIQKAAPRKTNRVQFVSPKGRISAGSVDEVLDTVASLVKVSSNVTRRKTRNRNAETGRNSGILDLKSSVIQTGKWRRSLIQFRKSQASLGGSTGGNQDQRRKSVFHRTVSLAPEANVSYLSETSFYGFEIVGDGKRRTGKQPTRSCRKTSVIHVPDQTLVSQQVPDHRAKVLKRCGQDQPLPFGQIYTQKTIPSCRKIGEGVYGEVFLYKSAAGESNVLKIIPIAGQVQFNGEPQKSFEEILSEVVIAIELSNLRNSSGRASRTNGFVEVKRVCCVQGLYPEYLVDLWELYRDTAGTENDHPEIFDENQIYVVFELANAGQDLEAFKFENAEQAYSALRQTAIALGVAEHQYKFEHRDLHWGNILLAPTEEKTFTFLLDGQSITIATHGVKATIIDFTLSRMVYDGCCLYNDLANDADLFLASGDYQFEIYRKMKRQVANVWDRFEPKTNVFWLHYVVDKMIDGVRYKQTKTKRHKAAIGEMMTLRDELLNFQSAFDYAQALNG